MSVLEVLERPFLLVRRLPPILIAVWFVMSATGAAAAPEPGTTMVYDIHHEDHGFVGQHRVSFKSEGDDIIVEVENDIVVKVLFITAYRFEALRQERWRDGKMIAYEGATHDDGTDIPLKAHAEGDTLVIEGSGGRAETPLGTFPSHPWNQGILTQRVVMETKTGELLEVQTASAGEETLQVNGRSVKTTRYQMTGALQRELWFDEEGNWVQLRFKKDGSQITFSLK
jgi:hypothetical protein